MLILRYVCKVAVISPEALESVCGEMKIQNPWIM